MTLRVGALLRKSQVVKDGDRALSIETQDTRVRGWSAGNGFQVDERFIWRENTSGWVEDYYRSDSRKLAKRDGLAAGLAALEAGEIDVLAVVSIDRLSRSGAGHVRGMIDRGYRFFFITEGWDSADPNVLPLIALFADMAMKHSRDKSETLRHVKAEARNRGFWSTRAPWGFVLTGERQFKRLTPDPALWPHVEALFHGVAEGRSLRVVAESLAAANVPSPTGKGWQKTAVRRIVANPVYVGWQTVNGGRGYEPTRYLDPNGQPVRVLPEGVGISEELAAKAQAVMTGARSIEGQKNRPTRLLAGLTRCDGCGAAAVYSGKSLCCDARRAGRPCPSPAAVGVLSAERYVSQGFVAQMLLLSAAVDGPGEALGIRAATDAERELWAAFVARWSARVTPEASAETETLRDVIKAAERRLERLREDSDLGLYDDDRAGFVRRVKTVKAELDNSRERLAALTAETSVPITPREVLDRWRDGDTAERREMLGMLFAAIHVRRGPRAFHGPDRVTFETVTGDRI